MKNQHLPIYLLVFLLSVLSVSCSAIAGIFKAGMGFGIFLVVIVVVFIIVMISKAGKK